MPNGQAVMGLTGAVVSKLLPPAAIVGGVIGAAKMLPTFLGLSGQRVDIETPLKAVAALSGDPRGAIAFERAMQGKLSREHRHALYGQLIRQLGGGPALRKIPRWRHMIVGRMVDEAFRPAHMQVLREQARAVRASRGSPVRALLERRAPRVPTGPPTTARAIQRFGTYQRRF